MAKNTYGVVKMVHLYASLSIVALLLMYVLSSYLMIHYKFFKTYEWDETEKEYPVSPEDIEEVNLEDLLVKNGISGKLTDEGHSSNGDWTRRYSRAGKEFILTFQQDKNLLLVRTRNGKAPGFLVGLHRIRGYEGSWPYHVYALLLDLAGVNLILFAVTGAILWLNLLKKDRIAWLIFILGFLYVGAVIAYLSVV